MIKVKYLLKSAIEPVLNGNVLVNHFGAYGIKLTYEVSYYKVWLSYNKFKITCPIPYKTETKIYLRPLKQYYSKERGRLPINEWGKKTHPLCGVILWFRVKHDYGQNTAPIIDFEKGNVKNHVLIRRLRDATSKDPKVFTDNFSFYK